MHEWCENSINPDVGNSLGHNTSSSSFSPDLVSSYHYCLLKMIFSLVSEISLILSKIDLFMSGQLNPIKW